MLPFTATTGQKNAQLCRSDACKGSRRDYASTHIADYYPFGMEIQRGTDHIQPPTGNLLNNRYLYNGKELQDDFWLNWYDYGARFYDAQIARGVVPLVKSMLLIAMHLAEAFFVLGKGVNRFWDRSSPVPTLWSLIIQEAGRARPTQVNLLDLFCRSGHLSSYLGLR